MTTKETTMTSTAITLDKGAHDSPDDGMCLLEAVSFVRGEAFSDHPKCVSPVLAEFGRNLNDVLPDDTRQQLVPFVALLPGTAGDGLDEARSYLALDWLIRVYTPTWLELAGLADEARALRELGRIVDMVSAERAGPVVRAGRDKAAAADAARDAAWDAAWAAAGAAAWAAAGDAAGAAAWDAAWDAARAAAGAAARDAARAAARDALAPTVEALQQAAIELFRTMITPEA